MSARDNVRRLFESAIINARAVISEIKTACVVHQNYKIIEGGRGVKGWVRAEGENT